MKLFLWRSNRQIRKHPREGAPAKRNRQQHNGVVGKTVKHYCQQKRRPQLRKPENCRRRAAFVGIRKRLQRQICSQREQRAQKEHCNKQSRRREKQALQPIRFQIVYRFILSAFARNIHGTEHYLL